MTILQQVYFGNTLQSWITAFAIFSVVFVLLKSLQWLVANRLSKLAKATDTVFDDLVVGVLQKTRSLFLVVISLYAASGALFLSPGEGRFVSIVAVLSLLIQGGLWAGGAIGFWLERTISQKMKEDAASATSLTVLGFISRAVLWTIVLLLALDNMGIDITALVTGLGIGGIAVALALQNVLGDLFASLSILLDKPFVVGDFVVVNEFMGSVEHIGLKTTRIRSLGGEQIVFSNSDLLQSRIRNYKRMYERRVVFAIGLVYHTAFEKLSAIPSIFRQIIEEQPNVRFDRAHFKEFADSSLKFEVVYYVLSPDYNTYMDTQQAINLAICQRFNQEGIEFAFPTRTMYLYGQNSSPGAAEEIESHPRATKRKH